MRGEILIYDPETGEGLISGDDLRRYSLTSRHPGLAVGRRIDFMIDGVEAHEPVLLPPGPVLRRVVSRPIVTIATSPTISLRDWKSRLFSLSGRMERAYFWRAALVMSLIHLISWGAAPLFFLAPLAAVAVCFWPYLAITTKRLHDIGQTGWLVTIPLGLIILVLTAAFWIAISASIYGVLAIGDPVTSARAFRAGGFVAIGAAQLIVFIQLPLVLLIGCRPGQPHDNRFGAPPTGRSQGAI